jgi:hypothetical protein
VVLNPDGSPRMVEEVTETVDIGVFDGKLALEVLARRFPDEWAATQRQRVEGPDGRAVGVEVGQRELPVQPVDAEAVAKMEAIMRRSPQLAVLLFGDVPEGRARWG